MRARRFQVDEEEDGNEKTDGEDEQRGEYTETKLKRKSSILLKLFSRKPSTTKSSNEKPDLSMYVKK